MESRKREDFGLFLLLRVCSALGFGDKMKNCGMGHNLKYMERFNNKVKCV